MFQVCKITIVIRMTALGSSAKTAQCSVLAVTLAVNEQTHLTSLNQALALSPTVLSKTVRMVTRRAAPPAELVLHSLLKITSFAFSVVRRKTTRR